ncbi:DUF1800 family protein [Ideonella sp. DXS22W]|uniref:DUF1800 family protein n=1 Tax=Pseudaquabacterium inlustre TaxID=2984192 RepID=A0ABU9CH12_9BURK
MLSALWLLAACGGGGGGASSSTSSTESTASAATTANATAASPRTTSTDAARLAAQASFGATEALVDDIRNQGPGAWIATQMQASGSHYHSGGGDEIDRQTSGVAWCDRAGVDVSACWMEYQSTQPLVRDFYRNALTQPDQLRQRVAFAIQQIVVVSNAEVLGTYGHRRWHNALLDKAFANWRDVLRQAIVSPLMGEYLGHINNHKAAPNENFARELLQLFSIGTCRLSADGRLEGGRCTANYDNETVRAYAYALTGWTYPLGGQGAGGCWPAGTNCRYLDGEMVALPAYHDTSTRRLLSGIVVPAGSDPASAADLVLDSLMAHASMGPFIGRQLIQHLVTSNPSAAYVTRVASAFDSGRYTAGAQTFGTGRKGDLAATVAAVLLDSEARRADPGRDFGRLREPALLFTSVLRALDGTTDGEPFGFAIGGALRQVVFRPPTVFSFYLPDQPLPGSTLVAPAFGIHGANTALARLNFLSWLIDQGGSAAGTGRSDALPTRVDLSRFATSADDAGALVDRLSTLATGGTLPASARSKVVQAVQAAGSAETGTAAQLARAKRAAWLVFASPQFQVQR